MEKLKIDVDNRSPFLKRIYLRQGDGGIQTVLINVVSGDNPVDCTGYTVKFKANLSDGKLVTGEAEPKDLANGEYTYTFKSAESSVYGDVRNAYFQLYDEAGNSISGSNVLITVEKGVDITQEQADNYVSELDKIIETVQGKADELAEFAEEEKGKITDEVSGVSKFAESQKKGMLAITADVSSFADSQKGLMTEAVTDVQAFAESEKNDITSIKNDVSGFADEQKVAMADKTAEVDNYGDMQKVAMLNKRLEIEQTGNQEKAKILAVLPDVESSIAEQAEQIADLQEKLVDVDLHQAWATGEDGEGFSNLPIPENLRGGTIVSATFTSDKVSGNYIAVGGAIKPGFVKKNKYYNISFDAEGILEKDIKIILQLSYANENSGTSYYSLGINYPKNKSGITRYTESTLIVHNATVTANPGALSVSAFSGELGSELKITNMKYSITDAALENDVFVPSSTDDPINFHPKYVGFGIKNSDDYQDYKWILNPEWAMANAIYGTEITTLKDQLADIQAWIQAHS